MKIQSASYENWYPIMGGGNMLQNSLGSGRQNGLGQAPDAALIDLHENKGKAGEKKQANRERVLMKYSPLVERYLISHKYETMNNVREWKMLLTQRREA
jgi:hypothetical protein